MRRVENHIPGGSGRQACSPCFFGSRRRRAVLVLAGVIGSAVFDHGARAEPPPPAPISVTVALPSSGPRQAIGAAVRPRLELIANAVNAQGGLIGRPLRLDFVDDGCSREGARASATATASAPMPPAVVIGHPCASAAITAAPLYQAAGLLFIAAGARHPALTEKRAGPLVLRASGRDDRQGRDAGRRLRELAGRTGATLIIHDRTQMARALADAALTAATSDGAPTPTLSTIVAGENDYQAVVATIAAGSPAAVLFIGFPAEAAILIRQLRQRGLSSPVLLNDAMAGDEFVAHAGELLEGGAGIVEVMMPVSIARDAIEESETADALVASDAAAALASWRDAVIAAASLDPQRIAAQLSSERPHLEELAFDDKGDAIMPSYAPFRRNGRHWRRSGPPRSGPTTAPAAGAGAGN